MSFLLTSEPSADCGERGLFPCVSPDYQPSELSQLKSDIVGEVNYYHHDEGVKYSSSSYSGSLDEGSYDEDRPHSRLTIIESPTPSYDPDTEDISQLSRFSLESPEPTEEYYPPGEKSQTHTCEECFKSFTSPGKLRQHEYSHTGETPFECEIPGCDKKFTSKFKLKRHILIHSQTKTFLCEVCHRAFRRKDHLKNHEKVHDPGKTVYTCSHDTCGRTYNSVSSYRKHLAMHSAEEGQLDCKICKMILNTREELINHLKIHAGSRTVKGSSDKKFMCDQCDKKFFTRKDLKRHSVVHTGNREFSCPHCTQRFGRKDHMTRHAKKTHPNLWEGSERTRRASSSSVNTGAVTSARSRFLSTPGHAPPPLTSLRPQRKERSISDPGPLRSPDLKISHESSVGVILEETTARPIGLPRQVIVHHSSARGVIEEGSQYEERGLSYSSSGGSVSYCDMSPPSGEFQKLLDLDLDSGGAERMVIKEEDEDDTSLGELLGVSGVRDMNLGTLMQEFAAADHKKEFICHDGDAVSTDDDRMMTEEEMMIKMEPRSPPASPDPSITEASMILTHPDMSLIHVTNSSSMSLILSPQDMSLIVASQQQQQQQQQQQEQESLVSKARFLRTPSQDSITRTKNPVLPSIHTETCLVVPEPNSVKYPHQQLLFTPGHDDSRDMTETLTELRGSLFFTDDQHYSSLHQPWN